MNRKSHKCKHCKKAFTTSKSSAEYCSNRCRQKAYRKRHTAPKTRKNRHEKELIHRTCEHCGGGFFGVLERAQFCSTSCRTMHHKAMRAAIPAAVAVVWSVPIEKAADLVDTQPLAKLKELLGCMGYEYRHERRAWVSLAHSD